MFGVSGSWNLKGFNLQLQFKSLICWWECGRLCVLEISWNYSGFDRCCSLQTLFNWGQSFMPQTLTHTTPPWLNSMLIWMYHKASYLFSYYRYSKVYNKKSKKWSLYTEKVEKDYSYIPDLQSAILRCRLSATGGLPRTARKRPDDPRQHGVLSGVPAPSMQELLQTQLSRGLGEFSYNIVAWWSFNIMYTLCTRSKYSYSLIVSKNVLIIIRCVIVIFFLKENHCQRSRSPQLTTTPHSLNRLPSLETPCIYYSWKSTDYLCNNKKSYTNFVVVCNHLFWMWWWENILLVLQI